MCRRNGSIAGTTPRRVARASEASAVEDPGRQAERKGFRLDAAVFDLRPATSGMGFFKCAHDLQGMEREAGIAAMGAARPDGVGHVRDPDAP